MMIKLLTSIITTSVVLLGMVSCTSEQQLSPPAAPVTPNTPTYGTLAAKSACIQEAQTIWLALDACMTNNGIENLNRSVMIGPGNADSGKWPITDGTNVAYVGEYLRGEIKGTYNVSSKGLITVLSYPGLTDEDIIEVNNQLKDN